MLKFFVYNFILSLLVFVYLTIIKNRDAFIKLCIMTFFPVGGILIFLILAIYKRVDKDLKQGNIVDHMPEDVGQPDLLPTITNWGNEINTIPVEDALILNDNHTKRTLIMDALKRDSYQYIGFLVKALKDSDTETSHYAATAVTEIKRKLTLSIQELEVKYENSKYDIEYLKVYSDVLKRYIDSGLLDDISYVRYLNSYSMVLSSILNIYDKDQHYYEEKINSDIKLKKFEEAKVYQMKYKESFRYDDGPYMLLLKIHFIQRDREAFKAALKELMQSSIKIKKESLKIIKFWLEGMQK